MRKVDRRDVVVPPVFSMDGKVDLKDYLKTFEQYFELKYRGTSHDKCQLLASFLEGDLLNIHQIRGGRKITYEEM